MTPPRRRGGDRGRTSPAKMDDLTLLLTDLSTISLHRTALQTANATLGIVSSTPAITTEPLGILTGKEFTANSC